MCNFVRMSIKVSSSQVRVWDRRDMRQCVMNMVDRDTRHDTWTVSARGEEVSERVTNRRAVF